MKNLDVMEYAADAQRIDETLMRRVLAAREGYDYEKFDALSVKRALGEENLSVEGLKALLSPAAGSLATRCSFLRRFIYQIFAIATASTAVLARKIRSLACD